MAVQQLNKTSFCQLVADVDNPSTMKFKGRRPAIVDFYATWCGPCNALSSIIEALSVQYADDIDFYKVDVDKQLELSSIFHVRTVPTLVFFPINGHWFNQIGYYSRSELYKIIEQSLLMPLNKQFV